MTAHRLQSDHNVCLPYAVCVDKERASNTSRPTHPNRDMIKKSLHQSRCKKRTHQTREPRCRLLTRLQSSSFCSCSLGLGSSCLVHLILLRCSHYRRARSQLSQVLHRHVGRVQTIYRACSRFDKPALALQAPESAQLILVLSDRKPVHATYCFPKPLNVSPSETQKTVLNNRNFSNCGNH